MTHKHYTHEQTGLEVYDYDTLAGFLEDLLIDEAEENDEEFDIDVYTEKEWYEQVQEYILANGYRLIEDSLEGSHELHPG